MEQGALLIIQKINSSMHQHSVIQYLFNAIENQLFTEIHISKLGSSKMFVTVVVSDLRIIKPTMWMIEANMYTNKNLIVKTVESYGDMLEIHCLDGMSYIINIVA